MLTRCLAVPWLLQLAGWCQLLVMGQKRCQERALNRSWAAELLNRGQGRLVALP